MERLIRLEEKLDNMSKNVIELKRILMGNGKPGFIKDVECKFDIHEECIKNIELKMAEESGGKKIMAAIFGSGIVTSLLTIISIKLLSISF